MKKLNLYNNFLIKIRGWVSKWPKKAVFIYSGGMDSTTTMAKLMEDYGVEIFPLFINRGQSNVKYEKKSALYFDKLFSQKYPNLYHRLFQIDINNPPLEIKDNLRQYSKEHGYPLRNTMLQMIGVQYAVSLLVKNEKIKTVFCAQVIDDPFPHSTLSSLRINTMNICNGLEEWDWQITSPNIDPVLIKKSVGKVELIKWADEHGIPIEYTRSCYKNSPYHCGSCLTCSRRKIAFEKAGLPDKTNYQK
jgi:7-cyano-7-deazaguanine synthase